MHITVRKALYRAGWILCWYLVSLGLCSEIARRGHTGSWMCSWCSSYSSQQEDIPLCRVAAACIRRLAHIGWVMAALAVAGKFSVKLLWLQEGFVRISAHLLSNFWMLAPKINSGRYLAPTCTSFAEKSRTEWAVTANVPFHSQILCLGDRIQVYFWGHGSMWKRLRRTGLCTEPELVTDLLLLPSVSIYSAGISGLSCEILSPNLPCSPKSSWTRDRVWFSQTARGMQLLWETWVWSC